VFQLPLSPVTFFFPSFCSIYNFMHQLLSLLRINCPRFRPNSSITLLVTSRTFSSTSVTFRYVVSKSQKEHKMAHETTNYKGKPFDRTQLESLMKRRMWYTPSFDIYGGVSVSSAGTPFLSLSSFADAHQRVSTTMVHQVVLFRQT
jgi:hypothetical protein